jgi:hypothetical protein
MKEAGVKLVEITLEAFDTSSCCKHGGREKSYIKACRG